MSSSEIARTVQKLRKTFLTGVTKSYDWRIQQLKALRRMMEENKAQFEQAMASDLRQGPFLKVTEVKMSVFECDQAISDLKQWMKPQYTSNQLIMNQPGTAYTIREPYGTVLIISPWNYPITLVVKPLVGAIAAGNNVVVKPSEVAPACSRLFAELIPKYLDRENIIVIEGAVQETTELLKQKFDYIFYTGNTAVGKIVMRAASENLTPVTLELGGKSPVIVARDADLNVTAKRLVWGKLLNLGQTCVAPDYVFVDKSIKSDLVKKMNETLIDFYGSDAQKSKDYSRIINERHCQRIEGLLKDHGGKVIAGGKVDVSDRYVAPTIIEDPSLNSKLMQEEIFGPVLPLLTMENIDEAIDYINSNEKPLALYLFSSSKKLKNDLVNKTSSGAVVFNDCVVHNSVSELPFGGVGHSGMGSYNGRRSFDTFSHEKPVLDKGTMIDPFVRYPPYSDTKLNIVAFSFRKFSPASLMKLIPLLVLGIGLYMHFIGGGLTRKE